MFSLSLILFLSGFGIILVDAKLRENYSLTLATFAGILIAGAIIFFVAGMLRPKRLKNESSESLP